MATRTTSVARQSATRTVVTKGSARRIKLDDDLTRVIRGEVNSKQVEDPFKPFYATSSTDPLGIIEPHYQYPYLMRMVGENAMLRQCIEAMVTNVEGHGYRLMFSGEDGADNSPEAKKEKASLEEFFDAPNESYSLSELRARCRWDLETVGNAYIEVARNLKGEVTALWHVPAHLMRLTNTDGSPTIIRVKLPRRGGSVEQSVQRYFRRYVQVVGAKKVYFKDFGDPRKIDPSTGLENTALDYEGTATEIIHLKLYAPGSSYGIPRWIAQIPSIKGSRQAELTNLEYFSDNAIPAMALVVAGGTVQQETMNDVEDYFQQVRGRKAQNRVIVIEAKGDENAAAENGAIHPPKVEFKSLRGDRQDDGLFMEYEGKCHDKVRSAFRLPPIFVGLSEDYNYATAKTSFEVAESQVFGSERAAIDDVINRKILSTWEVKYWQFRSNPPRITDPEEVIAAVETFDAAGALTPNIVIGLANELFDLDIPVINSEWGNWPFEIVKNLASAGKLKGIEEITQEIDDKTPPADPNNPDPADADPNEPGDPANPFTGDKQGTGAPQGGNAPADGPAMKRAKSVVRDALVELRAALVSPQAYVVEREDGDVVNVRRRVRK